MHHAYNFTGYYDLVPAQSDPSLRKLYGQLGSAAENQLWYDKLREVIDGYQPDILWQDFNLAPGRRVAAAELPGVLLQPGGRLEQGRRRHLQGRLQQPGRGLRLRARRPGRHPDPVLADRRQHLQLQLVLHGRHRLLLAQGDAALADRPGQQERQHAAQHRPDGRRHHPVRAADASCSASATTSGASASPSTPPAPGPAYGEGPTQMGGGSFTTPRAGTNAGHPVHPQQGQHGPVRHRAGLAGRHPEHHDAELEPDQPEHA